MVPNFRNGQVYPLLWDTDLLEYTAQEVGSAVGPATDVYITGGSVGASITGGTSAAHANVTGTGASIVVQAANTSRKAWSIFNDSGVTVYLKLGTGASSTSYKVKLVDQTYYALPMPVYTGVIHALWASGDVRVCEET